MTTPNDLLVRAAIRDELSGPLESIRRELAGTARAAEDAGTKANRGARGFDAMAGGIGRMAKTAGRVGVYALGGLATAVGAVAGAGVVMGVKTASAMQQARISFETMLGSAEKAGAFLGDLKTFAASTPFEFPELQTAASSLISSGVEAGKVIPIMRTLGDVTSGMGTGAEGVQRATVAIQQMNAAGKITGEDLNQLRDAGIPVYDLLAAATGKTKEEVSALAQAGKLGKSELAAMMEALETGKGLERFSGLMEKQSKSLAGVWSTLKDNVNMALADAIEPAIPALTGVVEKLGVMAGTYLPMAAGALIGFAGNVRDVWGAFQGGGADGAVAMLASLTGAGAPMLDAWTAAKGILDDVSAVITGALIPAVTDVTTAISPAWLTPLGLARVALGFLAENTEATRVVLVGLVAALTAAKVATILHSTYTAASTAVSIVAGAARGLLTGATIAQTGAEQLNTAARVQNIAATVRSTAVAVAHRVATVAGAIATGVTMVAAFVASTAAMVAHGIAVAAVTVASKVARGAALAWAAGQWLLNAALTANPIGLVIAAIALLVGGLVLAWNKSETFRNAVKGLWEVVKNVTPLGLLVKHFDKVKDAVGWVVDKVKDLVGALGRIKVPDALGKLSKLNPFGDTSTSHARGSGALGSTMAAHARYSALTGARPTITNALVGGGGRGHGSGDHQAGRALDLRGRGLAAYGKAVRADGGYASFHGAGAARHLHAVPAMGDTSRSVARAVRSGGGSSSSSSAGPSVMVAAGGIVIQGSGLDEAALERAVVGGLEAYVRDREERG